MAEPWKKGDRVESTHTYTCSNCGHHEEFKEGESFPQCPACLQGDPSEIWTRRD